MPAQITLKEVSSDPVTPASNWLRLFARDKALKRVDSTGLVAAIPAVLYAPTAVATIANTTTETTLLGAGVGTLTLPANSMIVGRMLRLKLMGYYSSHSSAGTLRFRIKFGSTTVLDTTALTAANSASSWQWMLEALISIRAVGGSGNVFAEGHADLQPATGAYTPSRWGMVNTAVSGAIAFNSAQVLDATVQWGTANAANTLTCAVAALELLW